ncbi:MAG: hypothetical protein JSU66_02795, partial [Deltaproteobacteria bacterium]
QRSVNRFLPEHTVFQAIRLGDVALLGLPAEIDAALGEAARAAVPSGLLAMPIAHANDWLGYGVSSDAYRRGSYEASLSFFGEAFGAWLLEQATATLGRSAASPERDPARRVDASSGDS